MEKLKEENEKLKADLLFCKKLNEILLKYRQNLLELIAHDKCDEREKRKVDDLECQYNQIVKSDENDLRKRNQFGEQEKRIQIDNKLEIIKLKYLEAFPKPRRGRPRSKVNHCESDLPTIEDDESRCIKYEEVNREAGENKISGDVKKSRKNNYDLSKFKVNAQGKILGLDKPKWMRGQAGFYCDQPGCDFHCEKRFELVEHMPVHTGVALQYVCGQCNQSFTRKKSLSTHTKVVHAAQLPFVCDLTGCRRAFATLGLLNRHKGRHLKINKYKCDWPDCGYRAKDQYTVEEHRRIHTGQRPFKCSVEGCDRTYVFRSALRDHMLSHTGFKKVNCPWPGCETTFKRDVNMKRHLLTHTGQKEMACDWPGCEYKGADSQSLKQHRKRIHLLIRNFACTWPGCEKKFIYNSLLQEHICTHTGEKPVQCSFPGCEKRFILKRNMITHRKAMHERDKNLKK